MIGYVSKQSKVANKDGKRVWYPQTVASGRIIDTKRVARELAARSGASEGDVHLHRGARGVGRSRFLPDHSQRTWQRCGEERGCIASSVQQHPCGFLSGEAGESVHSHYQRDADRPQSAVRLREESERCGRQRLFTDEHIRQPYTAERWWRTGFAGWRIVATGM